MINETTVNDAARRTVRDHGGGLLAKSMGIRPRIFLNKVNPSTRNKLTLEESVRLQQITGDCSILKAMALVLGYAVIPLEAPDPSDVELLTQYARWQDATGRVITPSRPRSRIKESRPPSRAGSCWRSTKPNARERATSTGWGGSSNEASTTAPSPAKHPSPAPTRSARGAPTHRPPPPRLGRFHSGKRGGEVAAMNPLNDLPPPPTAIRRKGIDAIETTLKPGQTIVMPHGLVTTLFGKELLDHCAATDESPAREQNIEENGNAG